MSQTSVRSGTQDNTSGTQVLAGVTEVGSGALQLMALVANKTTWSETSRTGLAAADAPTGGDLTSTGFGSAGLIDLENAKDARVRATCSAASKNMAGRLIFYDGSGNPTGYSELISFVSDATLRLGNATGDFVAQRQLVDVGSARKCKFFLVSTDASATWAVYVQPC